MSPSPEVTKHSIPGARDAANAPSVTQTAPAGHPAPTSPPAMVPHAMPPLLTSPKTLDNTMPGSVHRSKRQTPSPRTGLTGSPRSTCAGTEPGHRRSPRVPRKRTEPIVWDGGFQPSTGRREQKLLKMALARSVVETQMPQTTECPTAATFYPTVEEFASPMEYIASIQAQAERTGICKIVPPAGWKPAFAIDLEQSQVQFETRLQSVHKLQEGIEYGDGRMHTFASYRAHADAFRNKWLTDRGLTPEMANSRQIEQDYWRIVETGESPTFVEYANDLDTTKVGSGFARTAHPLVDMMHSPSKELVALDDREYYKRTAWNLNNLPFAQGSLLRHLHTMINGINVPWLYCGMLFATFCWHTEDNYMYSVNYQHIGASKRWYGIPASHSRGFEKVLRERVPERFLESPDLLFHLTTMVPPSVLASYDVPVFTLVQEPGEIVVTFPRGYHAGYSEGFNCNEACNFVLPSWIQYGRESVERYREVARSSIFSHDRFIFHFGSSQSLEEYSASECEMLLTELRVIFQEERSIKAELRGIGLEHVLELQGDTQLNDRAMSVDEVRECFKCKHNVFFSGVICTCSPTRLSCLRHAKSMCQCPIARRTLMEWVSLADLRHAIRRVQVKIQSLKREASGGGGGGGGGRR